MADLDALDYSAAIVDEIALEGLDGITLQALWFRLATRKNILLNVNEQCRQFVWSVVTSHPKLQLYKLPSVRSPLIDYNRFDSLDDDLGVVIEPKDMPPDPYPCDPVDDTDNGIRGSCSTYKSRLLLDSSVRKMSLTEAEQKYGGQLVIVASQKLRDAALVSSHVFNVTRELNLSQYIQLERIGRSRYHGEVTIGATGLSVLNESPKNLHYIRKKLIDYQLITKQAFFMRLKTGSGSQGRLYHLPRYYAEFRPKYQVVIEKCVEALRKSPGYMMVVSEMADYVDSRACLKKVAKHTDFARFIRYETVPYRTVYPNADPSEWRVKSSNSMERTLRVYRLMDPNADVRKVLDEDEDNENQSNSIAQDQLRFPDQTCLSLVHSVERQAYSLLLKHGPAGYSCNNIRRELGQSHLDSRALLKAIAAVPGATFTYREDIGKIRITKYVASCYSHLSATRYNINMEESMVKSIVNDSVAESMSVNDTDNGDQYMNGTSSGTLSFTPSDEHAINVSSNSADEIVSIIDSPNPANNRLQIKSSQARKKIELKEAWKSLNSAGQSVSDLTSATEEIPAGDIIETSDFFIKSTFWDLELFDPVTGLRLSKNRHVPLQDTDLFSKCTSSRHMKRTRLILQTVKKLRIVDHAYHLKKVIMSAEDRDNLTTRIDRRSFHRILKLLAEARLLRNYRLNMHVEGSSSLQKHMVTDYTVNFEDRMLRCCVAEKLSSYMLQVKADASLTAVLGTDSTAGDCEGSLWICDQSNARNVKLAMDMMDKPHPDAVRCATKMQLTLPKYRRLYLLHSLLFYMCRGYDGDASLDQEASRRQICRLHPQLTSPCAQLRFSQLPRIYHLRPGAASSTAGADVDAGGSASMCGELDNQRSPPASSTSSQPHSLVTWKTFISPLTEHAGKGEGWLLLRDVLLRLPLFVFVRLVRCPYVVPLLATYLEHPVLRYLPVSEVPSEIILCLRWKRKYMFAVHEDIMRLCFMGLVQLGPQLTQKDQLFVYVNRNACLLDTVTTSAGLYTIDPNETYPTKYHHFSSLAAITDYWHDLRSIALSTPLGIRDPVVGRGITSENPFEKELLLLAATERTVDEADALDTGILPGDQLGAGGIDSSMFTHYVRNWRDQVLSNSIGKLFSPSTAGTKRKSAGYGIERHRSGKLRRVIIDVSVEPVADPADVTLSEEVESPVAVASRPQTEGKRVGSGGVEQCGALTPASKRVCSRGDDVAGTPPSSVSGGGDAGVVAGVEVHIESEEEPATCPQPAYTSTPDCPALVEESFVCDKSWPIVPVRRRRSRVRKALDRYNRPRVRHRLPNFDEVDKRALSTLEKRRCTWTVKESRFLLLARVALQLLSFCFRVPPRQYITVRNALHTAVPCSIDKTAMAVRRRMTFVLRKPHNARHASLLYQEFKNRPDVREIVGDERLLHNYTNASVTIPRKFKQLMDLLFNGEDKTNLQVGPALPEHYTAVWNEYDLFQGDSSLLDSTVSLTKLDSEEQILRNTVVWFIMSYLACSDDKSPCTVAVYHTLRNYPESINAAAFQYLQQTDTATKVKRSRAAKREIHLETYRTAHPRLLTLACRLRQRFIVRYQYGMFSDMYLWFKTLLLNSLASRSPENSVGQPSLCLSLDSIQTGGSAAAMVCLLMLDKLDYELIVPENVIVVNDDDSLLGETCQNDETMAEEGGALPAANKSVLNTSALTRVSNSRIVLISIREQQMKESMVASNHTARGKGYSYHDKLVVTPCDIHMSLASARAADEPLSALSSILPSDSSSEPIRIPVDNNYIPVTAAQIRHVLDRHSRYITLSAEEADSADVSALLAGFDWSREQLQDASCLLQLLEKAGIHGVPLSTLPVVSGIADRLWLQQLLQCLEQCQLVLIVGHVTVRVVARTRAESWLLRSYHIKRLAAESLAPNTFPDLQLSQLSGVEEVRYVPVPWRRVGGALSRRVLDRLLATVLSHCVSNPGLSLSAVHENFTPQFSPCHVTQLVQDLCTIGAVKLFQQTVKYQSSLFSCREYIEVITVPADIFSSSECVIIQPTAESLLIMSCFIGDKNYSRDFMNDTGI